MATTDSMLGAVCNAVQLNLMSPALTAVWAVSCPQSHESMPYMVVRWPKTKFQWTFEVQYIEKPQLMLSIYHTSVGPAETGMRQILDSLKDAQLPLLVDRTMQLFPLDLYARDEPALSTHSRVVYQVIAPVEVWITR